MNLAAASLLHRALQLLPVASLVLLAATPPARRQTGTIEGVLQLAPAPQRRVAERYAAGGPAPRAVLQRVPPIIYLDGAFDPAASATAARVAIEQRDTTFQPAAVVVRVGGVVEFPNRDPFFHNVFSYSPPKRFDLGRYPRGESKSVRFDTPGIVKVYCEVHESMRAAVIVVRSPYYAVVDADGRFTLRDVPSGTRELVVWHADHGTRRVSVNVADGGTARVSVSLP